MSDKDGEKKDSSASEQDTSNTESQQKPTPVNHGRTFSGTGTEKRG